MSHHNSGNKRREFLQLATAVVGASVAFPLSAEAKGTKTKVAGGIPVPVADPARMTISAYPKGTVNASGRAHGANDRVNVAIVGTGHMGGRHVRNFASDWKERNIKLLGLIDVNQIRRGTAKTYAIEKGAATSDVICDKDYRRLLDNKDIDAIVIATPEHWHGQIAVHAMEAGKHVYIQKPMTRYLAEAFQVHDTALRTKRVVQVGSQGCSDPRFHAVHKAIREGKLGSLIMGQGSETRNSQKGEWNNAIDPRLNSENLDWDLWLGSAPDRPWNNQAPGSEEDQDTRRDDSRARYHRYRKYWDYSAGILGDLLPHKLHPFMLASGNPQYPTRVACLGTRMGKDREVHDHVQVIAEFPDGWSMFFLGSTVNEQGLQDVFRGHNGTVYFGNNVELRPERWASEELDSVVLPLEGEGGGNHEKHEKNWLDAIRGIVAEPNCNIDLATKVQTIICLAEMSVRLNRMLLFDAAKRKITYDSSGK